VSRTLTAFFEDGVRQWGLSAKTFFNLTSQYRFINIASQWVSYFHQQITESCCDALIGGEDHQLDFFSLTQIYWIKQAKLPFPIDCSDCL